MSLDLYQPCPGGLDKKIKFCCKDLAHQLDSVSRKLDGGQLQAADDELDRLLQQYPDRQCLWSMKVQAELAMGDVASVRGSNDKFLSIAPQNPIALALAAIIAATAETVAPSADEPRNAGSVSEDCRQAVDLLQSALEHTPDAIPIQVYDALGVVAERLLAEGMVIAAREHYAFQIMLDRENSQEAYARFLSISRSRELNVLMRQDMTLSPVPEEACPEREAYAAAFAAGSRGLWREAVQQLESAAQSYDAPLIRRALGILYCRLAENAKATAAWREFANSPGVAHDDAVEAEALAQLLDQREDPRSLELIQYTIPIQDTETALTTLQSDQRFQAMRFEAAADDEGPPPRAVFQMQDRVMPESLAIPATELPLSLGDLLLYGKETDKPARLTFIAIPGQSAQIQELLNSALPGQLAGPAEEEVLAKVSRMGQLDVLRMVQPREATLPQKKAWAAEFQEKVVLEKWLDLPQQFLLEKTPREASEDPTLKLPLEALVLLLETARDASPSPVFTRLRQRLGLPLRDRIVADHKTMRTLPIVRFDRIDPQTISDDDLLTGFAIANQTRYAPAISLLCDELLNRPSLHDKIQRAQIYGLLATVSDDLDVVLQRLQEAQKAALKSGASPARWKVSEFGVRILRQEVPEAQALLQDIQTHHIREPGIADMLAAELYRFGLARPASKPRTAAAPAAAAVPDDVGSVIVSGDEPATTAQGSSQPSKLWLPGMD